MTLRLKLVPQGSAQNRSVVRAERAILAALESAGGLLPATPALLGRILEGDLRPDVLETAVEKIAKDSHAKLVWIGRTRHLALARAPEAATLDIDVDPGENVEQPRMASAAPSAPPSPQANATTQAKPTASAGSSLEDEEVFSLQVALDVEHERRLLFRFLLVLLAVCGTIVARQFALMMLSL